LQLGGRFVLSDDSHGIAQVGAAYDKTLEFIKSVGITRLAVLEGISAPASFEMTSVTEVPVEPLEVRS
jgi:histidinol-phosphatase (PHP family)